MTSRRAVIGGGAGAAVLAALGYRVWDRGVFSAGEGPAYEPWSEWQGHAGEGSHRPLHAAILAASAHNTQPWIFEPHEGSITVYADRARNLGSFDPFRREMHLSLGCAIENLYLAAFSQGLAAEITFSDGRLAPPSVAVQPSKVAEIKLQPLQEAFVGSGPLTGEPFDTLQRLYDVIPKRHTNRGPYSPDRQLPTRFRSFGGHVSPRWWSIIVVTDKSARQELGALIIEATERIIADEQMSADSARWFRTGRREILAYRDGVTTDTAGLSAGLAAASKILPDQSRRTADRYWLDATRDVQVATAAAFGILFVQDRLNMRGALETGEAWQRLHLTATLDGIAAQPMNQPLEMMDRDLVLGRKNDYTREIRSMAGLRETESGLSDPAFIFRLGYAERPALPSPRRPLDDVLRTTGFA